MSDGEKLAPVPEDAAPPPPGTASITYSRESSATTASLLKPPFSFPITSEFAPGELKRGEVAARVLLIPIQSRVLILESFVRHLNTAIHQRLLISRANLHPGALWYNRENLNGDGASASPGLTLVVWLSGAFALPKSSGSRQFRSSRDCQPPLTAGLPPFPRHIRTMPWAWRVQTATPVTISKSS